MGGVGVLLWIWLWELSWSAIVISAGLWSNATSSKSTLISAAFVYWRGDFTAAAHIIALMSTSLERSSIWTSYDNEYLWYVFVLSFLQENSWSEINLYYFTTGSAAVHILHKHKISNCHPVDTAWSPLQVCKSAHWVCSLGKCISSSWAKRCHLCLCTCTNYVLGL